MNRNILLIYCVFSISACFPPDMSDQIIPEWIIDMGYDIRGGYYDTDKDFALGSHIGREEASAAWEDCSSKYMKIDSLLVEQCMRDKGLIRLSDIKRRQRNSEKLH